ncbi:Uncharacterised protein [Serratia liquefaciens]|uniref:hypothetical protein n=1 Tax=Serratia liquefaciens TaxID=614 RepID=UPI002182CA65|nr:hypothetical protein [Serratia liquefaciens]CAI2449020.1 Uncharacterised protein [Serratia liquefaciens]
MTTVNNISGDNINSYNSNAKKSLVTMNVNGVKKNILAFELRPSGDVIMLLRPAQAYREAGKGMVNLKPITQQRYTIHKSSQSKENINLIKHTLGVKEEPNIHTYLATPAIKSKTGFVHIFSRRYPAMDVGQYDAKLSKKISEIYLGDFDATKSTLFFSVFVGAAEVQVSDNKYYANTHSFVIGDFRFLLVWGFMMLHSHNSGGLIHQFTEKRPDGSVTGQWPGVDTETAVNIAKTIFQKLVDEFGQTLHATHDLPINFVANSLHLTGFVRNPNPTSPDIEVLKKIMYESENNVTSFKLYTTLGHDNW